MKSQPIASDSILGFAVGCAALSIVAALSFLLGGHIHSIRGAAGGVGFMAALLAGGVGAWFSCRARERRFFLALLLSLFPLAFWFWEVYKVVHA